MKYEWDPQKNEWLKEERNISFEKIVFHLSRGDVWKLADHPDQENYPGQRIYFVIVEEYVFLKTIIPSRKATKAYRAEQEG